MTQACIHANVFDEMGKNARPNLLEMLKKLEPKYEEVKCDDGAPFARTVISYKANDFGLYDTIGNVSEWSQDGSRTYTAEPQHNPVGPLAVSLRALRGGFWLDNAANARSAYRFLDDPGSRRDHIGFRWCLRST